MCGGGGRYTASLPPASSAYRSRGPIRCLLLVALGGHWLRQAPKSTPILVRYPDGTWAVPELGRRALQLGAGSTYASWWIRLLLHDGRGTMKVLLLRDQFRTQDWRALRAAIVRLAGPTTDG